MADLLALYQEEKSAYNHYLKVRRGDLLGGGSQPDPEEVSEAQEIWYKALETLRDAGGTPEVIRQLLAEQSSSSKVKRNV